MSVSTDPSPHSQDGPALLVERFLLEQSELTAAERFSQRHEESEFPSRAKYYRDLIPLSKPGPGEQYAFRVDLDNCSGCKACVAACHELNGLEDEETWREVGLLVGTDAALPILQHVTAACHHCLDPGCLAGCPVRAYDKDPQTGIVRHLDDQCIGCQYCVWMCPYEVPKFSPSKGIVRKCDMCQQRLAADEAPACVQSCPNQAISIELVKFDEVRQRAASGEFLAVADVAPDPGITIPTTRYVTRRPEMAFAKSADHPFDQPQHAHWPLITMLVLTQLAVGMLLVERVLTMLFALSGDSHGWQTTQFAMALSTLMVAATGLGFANCHLGRPRIAFRAILGWRTSWLSREVLVFGALLACDTLYVVMLWRQVAWAIPPWLVEFSGIVAAAVGLLAAAASAMVYVATKRASWSGPRVFWQFGISMILLGLTAGLFAVNVARIAVPELNASKMADFLALSLLAAIVALTCTRLFSVLVEMRRVAALDRLGKNLTVEMRAARLLIGPLSRLLNLRITFGILSGIIFPLVIVTSPSLTQLVLSPAYLLLQCLLLTVVLAVRVGSETLERYLFFVTALTRKMPGGMP